VKCVDGLSNALTRELYKWIKKKVGLTYLESDSAFQISNQKQNLQENASSIRLL
jgi:hypothetical protein